MGLVGGGDPSYTYKTLMFALAVLLLLPMFLGVFAPAVYSGPTEDEVLDGYERMTGQAGHTKVSVWPLTGIYLPFTGGTYDPDAAEGEGQLITYGYTEDGWLYGSSLSSYSPYQYRSTSQEYQVYKDDKGVFRYAVDTRDYSAENGTGHKGIERDENDKVIYPGDLYSEVNFDTQQKSDIFFVESSREETKDGHFYYEYNGYRYAFQPISNYTAQDQDGNSVPIIATTTSLSLVWYQYLDQSGVTGQLVLSGSNGGIAYLNAAQILSKFNNNTNAAEFEMVFNGVVMHIWIKIDPMATSSGMTVEQAYNDGRWSIMVTSLSTDASAYTGTDWADNPMQILQTMIDLLTFNMDHYDMPSWMATLCSFIYVAPFYVALITLCLTYSELWILWALVAAIAALQSAVSFLPW